MIEDFEETAWFSTDVTNPNIHDKKNEDSRVQL